MKPLETNQKVLIRLCLYPVEKRQLAHILLGVGVFLANLISLTSCVALLMKIVSDDLGDALYGLFQVSGFMYTTYVNIVAYFSRYKVSTIFDNLTEIYNASKFWFGFYSFNLEYELIFRLFF